MDNSLLLLILLGLLACSLGTIAYFSLVRPRRRYELSGVLDTTLLRVLLPREEIPAAGEQKQKEPKDIMMAMDQFYASLDSLRVGFWHELRFGSPAIAFEIALPHVGSEVEFYAALPHMFAPFFKKQLHAYFPSANIEESKDYNIFHPTGTSAGSVARIKRDTLLSLRTYRSEFGKDPLEVLAGSFAKLKDVGDGAAVQFVIHPASSRSQERGRAAARHIRGGASLKEVRGGFGRELKKFFMGSKSKTPDTQEKPKAADEELAKHIEQKAQRPAFDVNIRLVASSATPEETATVLSGLEAAFLQYNDPQGNELSFTRLSGRALEQLMYYFSFRMFSRRHGMYLSSEELATLFHFPYAGFTQPNVLYLKAREAPPPVNLPREGVRLGTSVFRGETRDVYLTPEDRRRHLYIIGQTGTGKSVTLVELARQDIQAGRGVCFIDPHGEAIEKLLAYVPKERLDDVIYFNPGDLERPLGLNFLEYDPRHPEQKSLIVNELLDIFNKLYNMQTSGGPAFEQYFRNAATLVMEDPASGNTLLEIVRIFADKEFRELKLSRSSNIVVNTFWRQIAEKATGEQGLQNYGPYVTNKFDNFLSNEIMRNIIAQEKNSFNFREVMDSGKILFVNLAKGRVGELNSALLGLIIVGRLLIAALSRIDIEREADRRDFYLYIDEFQNVTTKSIAVILAEARKFRLDLIIAHQYIGQLEEEIKKAVFGNVGGIASFRIGSDDGEFMEKQFSPVFKAHDLLNIDNLNAYVKILVQGQVQRPFNIKVSWSEPGSAETRRAAIDLSRLKYGRPREDVEAEIKNKYHV